MSGIVTRFAPSPTGRLHLGHAWSAILSHDRAHAGGHSGRFLLRIEDIDGTRSRPEHVAAIIEDLAWLGLAWDDAILFQSSRRGAYGVALGRLQAMNLLYPCFCTRAEIADSMADSLNAPHGAAGPVYPGTCRGIGKAEAALRLEQPHSWRLDMAKAIGCAGRHVGGLLTWQDEIAGPVIAAPHTHGDVVLARKDALASYHLAVVVDDAWQGVSHVVRGDDLRAATDIHRLLQCLLGLPTPTYRHHPLLADAQGRRLAKRDGAPTLEALRAAGIDGHGLADRLRAGVLPIGFVATNA